MPTPRVTFSLPNAVYDKLIDLSQATDTTISGLANRAVREWVEQNYETFLSFYGKTRRR
jgi:predicted transcriptional regulator